MTSFDVLRPPSPFDPHAGGYKDWLHLNLFDHDAGAVGVVNLSLHGDPKDPRSRVVGTALVYLPGLGWTGNTIVRGFEESRIGPTSIALDRVAIAVDHASGMVTASARLDDDGLKLSVRAMATEPAVMGEEALPLGRNWISWYVIPRLSADGELSIGGRTFHLAAASAYHDHNWGRWHWGDDLGWEWACLHSPTPGPTVVLACTTDRAHRRVSPATLIVGVGGRRRTFLAGAVRSTTIGELPGRPRRLPGAMAALHTDRAAPRLPAIVRVSADDGHDSVELEFLAAAAVQLITADPVRAGYGYIHELAGSFQLSGRLDGTELAASGLGVLEYVD